MKQPAAARKITWQARPLLWWLTVVSDARKRLHAPAAAAAALATKRR